MKILTINPGSTSTKVAVFEDDECLVKETIIHEADELKGFDHLSEQKDFRKAQIDNFLEKNQLSDVKYSAVVGRGGGLYSVEGGVYEVTDLLEEHACVCINGVEHPAALGPQLARSYAEQHGCPAYVVNPPDVDELQDVARMTGVKGVYRNVHLHALNLKETAIRHAENQNETYEEKNYIVCHLGGGISVSAHRNGCMVDGYDIVGGEGPMAPTRSGGLSLANVLDLLKDNEVSDVKQLKSKTGGFVSHLGTSDTLEVLEMRDDGNEYAGLVFDTLVYQVSKSIGSMSVVLKRDVDAILLGGGMAHNEEMINKITDYCRAIAPIYTYPGEFEMEAMAQGAIRVLNGKEDVKIYSGKQVWDGFDFVDK